MADELYRELNTRTFYVGSPSPTTDLPEHLRDVSDAVERIEVDNPEQCITTITTNLEESVGWSTVLVLE